MSARLIALSQAGGEVEVMQDVVLIGRDATCDVVLELEGSEASSRVHASITYEGGKYVLRDLGSLNGTLVNAQPVHVQVLRSGDVIEFGANGPRMRFESRPSSLVGSAPTVASARSAVVEHASAWPDDMPNTSEPVDPISVPRAELIHLNGEMKGGRVALSTEGVVPRDAAAAPVPRVWKVGRSGACDIRFDGARWVQVGREHASITFRGGGRNRFVLHDLNSRNGTFVNNQVVRSRELRSGDLIEFGPDGPLMRFELTEAFAAASAEGGTLAWSDLSMIPPDPGDGDAYSPLMDGTAPKSGRPTELIAGMLDGGTRTRTFGSALQMIHRAGKKRIRTAVAVTVGLSLVAVAGVWLIGQRDRTRLEAEAFSLAADVALQDEIIDSLRSGMSELEGLESELTRRIAQLQGDLAGVTDQSAEASRSMGAMRAELERLRAQQREAALFQQYARDFEPSVALIRVTVLAIDAAGVGTIVTGVWGTGFFADQVGHLVTNKHVAEPWKFDPAAACRLDFAVTQGLEVQTETAVWEGGSPFRTATADVPDVSLAHSSRKGEVTRVTTAPDRLAATPVGCTVSIVNFRTGVTVSEATHSAVVRIHEVDNSDIAILRVAGVATRPLVLATKAPRQGESVMTLGFPAGDAPLEGTIAEPLARHGVILRVQETIAIDVPITGGNSGGPLVDREGNVIGIVTRGLSDGVINNALKIEHVRRLLYQVGLDP